MLGDVIHLKSRPAETSKRTLRGMVEGQEPHETTSPFSGHPSRPLSKITLGYLHQQQSVPAGGKNIIAVQDLHSRDGQLLSPNPPDGTRPGSRERRELSRSPPQDTSILLVSSVCFLNVRIMAGARIHHNRATSVSAETGVIQKRASEKYRPMPLDGLSENRK
jgi:hypothetical protein